MDPVFETLVKKGPLASCDIQEELVLHYNLSRDAARKRIQRLYDKGSICRFLRFKAGGYLYYLPDSHPMELVIKTTKKNLNLGRPKLGRIVELIDKFKVISVFELCRLVNLEAIGDDKKLNPDLTKFLEDLKHLEYNLTTTFFVTSPSLRANSAQNLIRMAEKKFEEEANLLYVAKDYFLEHHLADNLQLYRAPTHFSLVNKFDAFGGKRWGKKTQVILECNTRRPVQTADIIGYQQRVFSTIYKGKKHSPPPTFCHLLGYEFTENAMQLAFSKGIRPIKVQYDWKRIPLFHILKGIPQKKRRKRLRIMGRLAESKGRAFESAVEKVFRHRGFRTETRKYFYLEDGKITEKKTSHRLTDIDVFGVNEKNKIAILIECKSAKKQISRRKLLHIVKNFGEIGYYLRDRKKLNVSGIVISNFNELDIVDAKRRSEFAIAFFSPYEFYSKYKKELRNEPKWLFSPPSEVSKSINDKIKIVESVL